MKAIVLDTETTGLTSPEVIELASIPVDDYFNADKDNLAVNLFQPNKEIEKGAQEVHGISVDDLKGMPNCKDLWTVSPHLSKAEYIIGHHIAYDINAINNSIGDSPKKLKTICTKRLAYEILGPQPSYSLVNLVRKYAPTSAERYASKAHSAVADIMMTTALLEVLVIRLEEKISKAVSVDDLYQYSSALSPMRYEDYKRI